MSDSAQPGPGHTQRAERASVARIFLDGLVEVSLTALGCAKRVAESQVAEFLDAQSVEEKVQVASTGVYVCMAAMCVLAVVPHDRLTKLTKCVAIFVLVALADLLAAQHEQPFAAAIAYATGLFCMCQVVLLPGLLHACRLALGVLLRPVRLASGQRALLAECLEQLRAQNALQSVYNAQQAAQHQAVLAELKAVRAAMTVVAAAAHRGRSELEASA